MWLKELLELPNGSGSHDTFGRVFARLDPKQFEASFFAWVQSLHERITGVIAIDGKTLYHEVKETFVLVQAEQFAHVQHQFHQTVTKGHGRLEIRR
jgi:DDE_Tnp_1-associated